MYTYRVGVARAPPARPGPVRPATRRRHARRPLVPAATISGDIDAVLDLLLPPPTCAPAPIDTVANCLNTVGAGALFVKFSPSFVASRLYSLLINTTGSSADSVLKKIL